MNDIMGTYCLKASNIQEEIILSPAFGEMSLSLDHCLMSIDDLVSQWRTVHYYRSFRLLKMSASDFSTVGMCRRFHACVYEFLTTVTEGVVHSVHKVVAQSSFGVIW